MTQKHIEQKVQRPVYFIPSFPELIAITFGASFSRKFFLCTYTLFLNKFGYTTFFSLYQSSFCQNFGCKILCSKDMFVYVLI